MTSCQKVKCLVKEMSSWSKLLRQNNFSKLKLDFNPFAAALISQNKKTNTKKNARNEKKLLEIREVGKKKLVESSKPLASTVLELFNFSATGGGGRGALGLKSFPGFEEG